MLDTVISEGIKCPLHVMSPCIILCHMNMSDRVMKYPLHHWPCLYTTSMCKSFLFQDWMASQVSSFNFPLVGPPFENSIKSLVVGHHSNVTSTSPWWGNHSSVTPTLRGGEPFEIDINSPWWGNHSRLTSIHVFRTAIMCHINPRAGDSNWVSYQFTWLGHHSGVTSAPHGGDTIRMWRWYITISVTIVKQILVRCILITWTCKRVQIHNGDNVNDSYWGEILQMR